ncbi:LysR family transcriptional regulator [Pseudonocardia kunmingensis]|uniref:LysR family transcriptional regulator n=1 Tax=Pseudonocardia kunmingensis TaxID=630975 RepID=UPI00114FDEDE|nr:LysR family transcriptional regulator [Pseudonocardia kunmingensis]
MVSADDLRYFLAVARRGRLTLAAAQLGVDHTTVGRRVVALERALGQRLFDRAAHGWQLTESGHRLLGPAELVATAVASAEELLGGRGQSLTGAVRIVCPDGFGAFLLAPALGALQRDHPALTVELITASPHVAHTLQEFDLAVIQRVPSSRRVVRQHLTDFYLRLYATPDYLSSHPRVRSAADLADHVVIWHIDDMLDVPPLSALHALLPSQIAIQSTNLVAHWQAAAAGVGIAPLPQYIAAHDPRLVPVLPELQFRGTYWLALRREHARLTRVRAVEVLMQEIVAARQDDLLGPIRGPLPPR